MFIFISTNEEAYCNSNLENEFSPDRAPSVLEVSRAPKGTQMHAQIIYLNSLSLIVRGNVHTVSECWKCTYYLEILLLY